MKHDEFSRGQVPSPENIASDEAAPGTPHTPRLPGRDPKISIFAESDTDLILGDHKFVVVGYTHRTASLAVRSRFAVAKEDLPPLAREFKALPGVGGCVLLATCNRLEAYLEIRSEAEAEAAFVDLMGGHDLEGRAELARCLMVHRNGDAVRHLLRVASGLDAMVLGDAQILGQTKEAYRKACQHGTAGPLLHKAFHIAFRCAKKVRFETGLGDEAHSVAGSAITLLARVVSGLRGKEYLLIGVNEMIAAAGKRLVKAGAGRLWLCNRTATRGKEFAAEIGAAQVRWEDLKEYVGKVDAIVTSTGASEPIFTRSELVALAAARPERLLTVVDIAVPPDIEPWRPESPEESDPIAAAGVRVIDLENVGAFQQEIEERRCQAAAAGESIVSTMVTAFSSWLQNQTLGPKMEQLRDEAEQFLARELQRLPEEMSAAERDHLTTFGKTMIKRFLGAYRRIEEER